MGHDHSHDNHHNHPHEIIDEVKFENKYEEWMSIFEKISNERDIDVDVNRASEELTEREVQVLILFAAMKKMFNRAEGGTLDQVAEYAIDQLSIAGKAEPVSTEFMNSLFNFNTVYSVLFDLMDLSIRGSFDGKIPSDQYRRGIVDSIVALRKYQTELGFGDWEWSVNHNIVINKDMDRP